MSKDKNDHVVIALFASEEAADAAVSALKSWDAANKDIKLGAVGTITKEGDKVKTNVGRKTGKGAKVGAVLFVASAVLTGGGTLVASAASGAVVGGVAGTFFNKSTNLTKEEFQKLGAKLGPGNVAVVVTCDESEVEATRAQLVDAGGQVQSYAVPAEALDEASQAVEANQVVE
jgi:outer membrane lipoprotein SlyB